MKREELQIKTDSVLDSDEMINIWFYKKGSDKNFSDIQIKFGESFISFHVGRCYTPDKFLRFDKDPPPTASKTWRIFQEEGDLKIWCNDELVLNWEFPNSDCKERYRQGVARVKFREETSHPFGIFGNQDTASENYRIKKG